MNTEHKQAYFSTLASALEAEQIRDFWPEFSNISYGETVRHHVQDGSRHGRIISVYRSDTGRYERPVTYKC